MPTIQDVAKLAGVSVTTVSRVINSTAPVNQKTKEKVLGVMSELNYMPSLIAQGMRTRKSKSLAIIIPDYMNSFYYELLKHMESLARKEGYHIIVVSADEDSDNGVSHINELFNRNIDGIIVCMYKGIKETIEHLLNLSKKIPVIFMDNLEFDRHINSVSIDGYAGIKTITQHMIRQGHKNIAFIKHIQGYMVANDRYQGYIDAINEAGFILSDALVYEGGYHIQDGYEAAKYFFARDGVKPTAIIASNDLMAIGAMNYIKSEGLGIPQDVAVAGFDDIYMSRLVSPPVTTYRQPIEEIARETVNLFINKINHPSAKNRKIILKGELIVRRSTDITKTEIETIL